MVLVRSTFGPFISWTLLTCCIIACENGAMVHTSSVGDLQGAWKVTGIETDSTMTEGGSMLVGLMGLFDPDSGDRSHQFASDEYIVTDNSGKELHRWQYEVHDTMMVIGSDTCALKWIDANSFTLVTNTVRVHYERVLGRG